MRNDNKKNIFHIPYASRLEVVLYIALACFNIAIASVLIAVFSFHAVLTTVFVTLIYLLEVAFIGYRRAARLEVAPKKNIHELLAEEGSVVLKNTMSPVVAFNSLGTILWYNDAMREALDSYESYVSKNITSLFGIKPEDVTSENLIIKLDASLYTIEGFEVSKKNDGLYIAWLTDVTKLKETEKKYMDEKIAVAYIAIDNVEDVLQYVHEKFADAITRTEEKLKAWAASMNGVIKSYDKDKYIMLFESKHLDKCIESKFDILDEIRDSRVGDSVSITVSMGISRSRDTLAERELDARDAIDLALQRGGDQVVYKSEDGTDYYGGRTKTVYKRSNVRSRSFSSQLASLMVRSDNVLIMGHRYGDFDSIGSAVGVARLAMLCGIKANIAIDLHDKNLRPCIEMLQKTSMYSEVFVDNADGLDLLGADTLVILVDHGSIGRAQFSDIAKKAMAIAVIDHHRKTDNMSDAIKLSYIEPSASSTCELVTEMLESAVSSQNLIKEEADILLAGILLDTKQFTRNTGTRTFAAAQYLRGAGANPTDVYNLFKTEPEDLSKEARFHTSITMYRGSVAIASCDGETDDSFRIIASKAADKMLTLRGVEAAFALVRIGEQIHISARSAGVINVQLILERLGGGGHFDVAGAQITADSIQAVLADLRDSIDTQFDS